MLWIDPFHPVDFWIGLLDMYTSHSVQYCIRMA